MNETIVIKCIYNVCFHLQASMSILRHQILEVQVRKPISSVPKSAALDV